MKVLIISIVLIAQNASAYALKDSKQIAVLTHEVNYYLTNFQNYAIIFM